MEGGDGERERGEQVSELDSMELIARLSSQITELALQVSSLSARVEKLEHPRKVTDEELAEMYRQAAEG